MSDKYQKQIDTIKAKGAKAYEDGLTIDQCPYTTEGKQGRKFRRIWIAGYVDARDHIYHGEFISFEFKVAE